MKIQDSIGLGTWNLRFSWYFCSNNKIFCSHFCEHYNSTLRSTEAFIFTGNKLELISHPEKNTRSAGIENICTFNAILDLKYSRFNWITILPNFKIMFFLVFSDLNLVNRNLNFWSWCSCIFFRMSDCLKITARCPALLNSFLFLSYSAHKSVDIQDSIIWFINWKITFFLFFFELNLAKRNVNFWFASSLFLPLIGLLKHFFVLLNSA